MSWYQYTTCVVSVFAEPLTEREGPLIEDNNDGSLTVFVREPSVDGKANDALVKLLAKHFDVPKTRIAIVRGLTSKTKVVEVTR